MSDYSQKLFGGSTLAFAGFILAAALSYILRIILARFLSVEEVGLFFSVLSFVVFITLFQKIGTELSLVRYINVWREKRELSKIRAAFYSTFLFQIVIGILYLVVIYLLSDFLSTRYFHDPLAKPTLLLLSTLLILLVFEDLPRRLFQGFNDMFWFSVMEAGKAFLLLLFVVIGLWYNRTVLVPVISFLAATLFISILGIYVSFRKYAFLQEEKRLHPGLFKEVFGFGLPLIFFVIGNKIIDSIDLLVLTYFRSLAEVGVYSIVLPTAGLCLFFYRPLAVVLIPLGSELWARNQVKKLQDLLHHVYHYLFLLVIPLIILFFIHASFVLSFLFGEMYIEGTDALRLILLGVFFFGLAHINISILIGVGNSKKSGIVMLYGAGINFLLNIILIPFWGMVGAGLATLISYLFCYVLSLVYVKKEINLHSLNLAWFKFAFTAILFTLVSVLFSLAIPWQGLMGVLISSFLSLFCYVILITSFGLFTFKELKSILSMIVFRKKV